MNWLDRECSPKCFRFKASGHCIDIIETIEELNVPINVLFMSLYQERLKQFVFYNLPNCHILLKKIFLFSIWMNLCSFSVSLTLCERKTVSIWICFLQWVFTDVVVLNFWFSMVLEVWQGEFKLNVWWWFQHLSSKKLAGLKQQKQIFKSRKLAWANMLQFGRGD